MFIKTRPLESMRSLSPPLVSKRKSPLSPFESVTLFISASVSLVLKKRIEPIVSAAAICPRSSKIPLLGPDKVTTLASALNPPTLDEIVPTPILPSFVMRSLSVPLVSIVTVSLAGNLIAVFVSPV